MASIGGHIDSLSAAGLFTEETGHAILRVGNVDDISQAVNDIHGTDFYTLPATRTLLRVDRLNHLENLRISTLENKAKAELKILKKPNPVSVLSLTLASSLSCNYLSDSMPLFLLPAVSFWPPSA